MQHMISPSGNEGDFFSSQDSLANPYTYGARVVQQYFDFRGDIGNEVSSHLNRAEPILERYKKSVAMGNTAAEEVMARTFYDTMVRPFVLKGTLGAGATEKTFAPNQTYIDNLVSQMQGSGVTSQMYIRLLQSRPGEAPTDSRIGYSALELLRTWAIRTTVAKEFGLNYGVNIVDETEAFDHGDALGFTAKAIEDSYAAIGYFLNRCGLSNADMRITPFAHQANLYRGPDRDAKLAAEYGDLLKSNMQRTREDIRLGEFSLSAVRAVMIHRLRHGDGFASVSANRDFEYLTRFPRDDVDETLRVSEGFNSALEMRTAVKRHVGEAGLRAQFPEFYSSTSLLHWGISKKTDRLSIQPNFKVYKGRLVTPGYALPVYSKGSHQLLGLNSYSEHTSGAFEVVNGPNNLPAALIKKE